MFRRLLFEMPYSTFQTFATRERRGAMKIVRTLGLILGALAALSAAGSSAHSAQAEGGKPSIDMPHYSSPEPDLKAPLSLESNNWTNLFPSLSSVAAISSTDAWAVGEHHYLLHFDGISWTVPSYWIFYSSSFSDVAVLPAGSVWIAGGSSGVVRYNAGRWDNLSAGLADLTVKAISPV